jgi:hypothetical protein
MEDELQVWRVKYSYSVGISERSKPYKQAVIYLVVADSEDEALKKGDNLFSNNEEARLLFEAGKIPKRDYRSGCMVHKRLLAGKRVVGEGAALYDLKKFCKIYTRKVKKPQLSGSDAGNFSLEARLTEEGETIEYLVVEN